MTQPSASRPEARGEADRADSDPLTLRLAVWLLAAQSVPVAAGAAYLAYKDLTAVATDLAGAVFETVFFAGVAVLLALCARGLRRRAAWARGPAVVLELMLLPIGYYLIQAGRPGLGVPVLIIGLLGVWLLVAPGTRQSLESS